MDRGILFGLRLWLLFLLLLLLCVSDVAHPVEHGAAANAIVTIENGRFVKDGAPLYAIGANYFDLFLRRVKNPDHPASLEGLAALAEAGIRFVRFSGGGFWPVDWKLYREDKERWWALLDELVREAERLEIGLVPSVFWHHATVPDIVGESVDRLGDPESETWDFMRAYLGEMVARYRSSRPIWGWEVGNEWNLMVDLPNAATHRPPTVPRLGTSATRSERDELLPKPLSSPTPSLRASCAPWTSAGRSSPVTAGHAPRPGITRQRAAGLGDIVKSGDKVGIKINMTGGAGLSDNFSSTRIPPFELYMTHPEVSRAVCELVKDAGAGKIYILEAFFEDASLVYEDPTSGLSYKRVADGVGATIIDLQDKSPYADYTIRNVPSGLIYGEFTQNGVFDELDCFISLPKAKAHANTGVTHAMKNLVGTLPVPSGLYNKGESWRRSIHEHPNGNDDLCRVIIDLNRANPIHLAVNDAIQTTVVAEGPWITTLFQSVFNTLIAAKNDMVAADTVGTSVIGFDPQANGFEEPFGRSLNYLILAEEQGLGTADPSKIEVIDATAL